MLKSNIANIFSIIMGKYIWPLKATLEANTKYHKVSRNEDYIELLKTVKSVVYNPESKKHKCHSIFESKKLFHSHYQANSVSMDIYYENFNINVQVIENSCELIGLYTAT